MDVKERGVETTSRVLRERIHEITRMLFALAPRGESRRQGGTFFEVIHTLGAVCSQCSGEEVIDHPG